MFTYCTTALLTAFTSLLAAVALLAALLQLRQASAARTPPARLLASRSASKAVMQLVHALQKPTPLPIKVCLPLYTHKHTPPAQPTHSPTHARTPTPTHHVTSTRTHTHTHTHRHLNTRGLQGVPYQVNFEFMSQKNKITGNFRPVRRVKVS